MGPGHGPMPSHAAERLTNLVQGALDANHGQTRFESLGRIVLVAQSVVAPSGRHFVLAGKTHSPPGGRAPLDSGALLLRLAAVLGTGTLLCYGMARYLPSPVVALRAATRRLAEGDLQARSGGEGNRRRDELADLSRDFDQMAARIETLMTSERRLAQVQRRLLGDVSHELRSPLTRLSVALALARHHESAPEAQKAHERIGRETLLSNEMIGQLLQLARLESELESSDLAPATETIELGLLVQKVASNAQFEARQRGRDVQLGKIVPCRVLGHEPLLHSAIENVVRNAIRYTGEGTPVEIELGSVENSAVLTVRDHGEGVPPDALSELWKPFYRVESSRDRDSGGFGLGLAITKRAIDWHGGLISARNARDGGLLIQIHLPLEIDIDSLF